METYNIIDTTLRDGEQTPGVSFSLDYRIRIAQALCDLGIQEIEIRSPVLDLAELEMSRNLLAQQIPVQWLCWCRAHPEDLAAASALGHKRVHIAYPVSEIQLGTIHKKWNNALPYLESVVRDATRRFNYVSLGAQDACRAPIERLLEYAQCAKRWGVRRLRLADTLGILLPSQVQEMVTLLHHELPDLELEFHGHNDLGLATANALAALHAGARHVSATVLGLGERTGNTSLEQVLLALSLHEPQQLPPMQLHHISRLCELVAQASQRTIPLGQPLVGAHAIRHQSGIHIAGMLQDPRSYQPYPPEWIGRTAHEFEVGALSGKHALRHALAQEGIRAPEAMLGLLLQQVRAKVRLLGRSLSTQELRSLI